MERGKCLGRYQKGVLLLRIIMILAFVVLYSITISRVGYAYKGGILVPKYEDGSTVYSGKIHGAEASFTIYDNKSIMFQYDDKTYGLYTAEEDSAAIPKDSEMKSEKISPYSCGRHGCAGRQNCCGTPNCGWPRSRHRWATKIKANSRRFLPGSSAARRWNIAEGHGSIEPRPFLPGFKKRYASAPFSRHWALSL